VVTPYVDRGDCYTVLPLYRTQHSDASNFFYADLAAVLRGNENSLVF
jgi:hypothetical protein